MVGVGPDPLSAWVCGHGSPVRGSFFRCESANVGLWSWAMTEGGGGGGTKVGHGPHPK
jgi:hypothetical protein